MTAQYMSIKAVRVLNPSFESNQTKHFEWFVISDSLDHAFHRGEDLLKQQGEDPTHFWISVSLKGGDLKHIS